MFFDEEMNICNVIDFDDSMYHWYAMDIEQAIDSLHELFPSEFISHKKKCFMDGYLTEYDI